MADLLQAKEIKDKLRSLIREADSIDPSLARRLEEINRWVKDLKTGSLTAKRFVLLFLQQIIRDSQILLALKVPDSEEERKLYYARMTPTERYWYGYLFPKWLNESDTKFYIWKKKLMAGEFYHEDASIIKAIATEIIRRQGTFWYCYVADFSMATDIIASSRLAKPLCIQLTTVSDEFSQEKSQHWENTMKNWGIERGLFLSFDPTDTNLVNRVVNILLYNSDRLSTGVYLKFSL